MAGVRFTDMQTRPTEFLDLTSLTLDEFQSLVPPFEAAFQAHMAAWRLDGKPRTTRQFSVYKNCPLPTPAARRLRNRRRLCRRLAGGGTNPRRRRTRCRAGLPPFAHDGTERRIVRPQDPAEQKESYS